MLAVKAQVPAETLRRGLPNQIKIGPVEHIRELISVALPGIAIRALPVAPRQLPFYPGTSYFELDRSSPYWALLARLPALPSKSQAICRARNGMLGDPRMSHGLDPIAVPPTPRPLSPARSRARRWPPRFPGRVAPR